jgi:hypothetical protein
VKATVVGRQIDVSRDVGHALESRAVADPEEVFELRGVAVEAI